jgi:peptidoglycan/LPS O-acetylase OafA/YrhL
MKHRFLILDGARGMAALAVLLYHLKDMLPLHGLVSGSFLAVDLFFLMSGFVIGYSYESKLLSGDLSFLNFARVRVIRLYPLYLAAVMIGLAYFVSKNALGLPDAPKSGELLLASVYATLLVPDGQSEGWGFGNYPFAPSAWSLSLEIWLNVAYAAVAVHLSSRRLVIVCGLALLVLIQQAMQYGTTDLGWGLANTLGGVARFCFSFGLGLLIWRHRLAANALTLPLCLATGLATFAFVSIPHKAVWLQLAWICFVFPCFLCLAASGKPGPALAKVCDHFGRLSYAVYILHAPLVLMVLGACKVVVPGLLETNPAIVALGVICLVISSSAVLTYAFDEPLRRWIRRPRAGMVSAA